MRSPHNTKDTMNTQDNASSGSGRNDSPKAINQSIPQGPGSGSGNAWVEHVEQTAESSGHFQAEGIQTTGRKVAFHSTLPLDAVNLPTAAAMVGSDEITARYRETMLAGGQFTLDEIAAPRLGNEIVGGSIVRAPMLGKDGKPLRFRRGSRKGQVKMRVVSKSLRRWRRSRPVQQIAKAKDFSAPAFDDNTGARAWDSIPADVRELAAELPSIEQRRLALNGASAAEILIVTVGHGCAARAARRMLAQRGVKPSETSVADAGQDAAAAICEHVRGLTRLSPDRLRDGKLLRVLWLYGMRGAWKSLCSWAMAGMTGDTAQAGRLAIAFPDRNQVPGSADDWQSIAASVLRDIADEDSEDSESVTAAKSTFVRWVYRVGLFDYRRELEGQGVKGNGLREALRGAKRRCRVVAGVIRGDSLAQACAAAGFDSIASFNDSVRRNGFWQRLASARLANDNSRVEQAKVAQRRFALEAATALRQLRKLSGSVPAQYVGSIGQPDKPIASPSGVIRQCHAKRRELRRIGHNAAAHGMQWDTLTTQRARALELAKFWRNVAANERKASATSFERLKTGIGASNIADLKRLAKPSRLARRAKRK